MRGLAAQCPILDKWARDVQSRYSLARLELEDRPNGDLVLAVIVVPPAARNKGIGTKVMGELVALADQNSRRIWLTPSKKSTAIGSTSKARLVAFYKQFGFVENKGRNRDFTERHTMYRDPGGGTGQANYGSGHGFKTVGLESMATNAAVRRALWAAGVREVFSDVRQGTDGIRTVIKDARGRILGRARAMKVFFEPGDRELCVRAFAGLKAQEPRITSMWVVRGIELKRALRRRGVGAILYRVMIDAAAANGGALVPDGCFKGGKTSKAALAAWARMRGPAWGPFRWNSALLPGKAPAAGHGRGARMCVDKAPPAKILDAWRKDIGRYFHAPVSRAEMLEGWKAYRAEREERKPRLGPGGYRRYWNWAFCGGKPDGPPSSRWRAGLDTMDRERLGDAVELARTGNRLPTYADLRQGTLLNKTRRPRGRSSQSLSQSLSRPSQSLSTSIDPVMNPAYNLREVYKQAVLLEDHLVNPRKRCQDCISKHAHAIEAFIEEACGLDKAREFAPLCAQLHAQIRAVQARLVAGDDLAAVAQDVRAMRKQLNSFVRLRPR